MHSLTQLFKHSCLVLAFVMCKIKSALCLIMLISVLSMFRDMLYIVFCLHFPFCRLYNDKGAILVLFCLSQK